VANIYSLIKYLEYKLLSSHKNGHGIHSPFLFSLITKTFRNNPSRDVVLKIESCRKKMLADKRSLTVTDYGSGGRKRGLVYERKIASIARNSSVTCKYGKLLYSLSAEFGGAAILELGTSFGIGSMYLAAGSPASVVHTIEGCAEIACEAQKNFRDNGFNNIILHDGIFADVLAELRDDGIAPGLVWIDGDHGKEALIENLEKLYQVSDDMTVIAIDDIHQNKEMGEAWDFVRSDRRVTLSVDLYRLGIIFFRKGMTPASVVIRY